MWISTRAQYGMRALVEIALKGDEPVSLKYVSEQQGISQHYLEQLVAVLRKAGYVESIRGAYGGYRIAKPLEAITALEVVELLEGNFAPVSCIEDEDNCDRSGHCSTEGLWREVDQAVRKVLSSTTLANLVAERQLIQLEPLPAQFAN
ncbi:MAG: Rrf2 family transcriptional regulator [Trueperaceae bacterium]|nr:Rrf2 family transcriptional regulator [Trueperaceae bacterium]